MKREHSIGADVAGVVIGAAMSALLYATAFVIDLPPESPLYQSIHTHEEQTLWGSIGIAAILGMTLPAHGIRLRSLMGGAILVGIGGAISTLRSRGPHLDWGVPLNPGWFVGQEAYLPIPDPVTFFAIVIGAASIVAAGFVFGVVTAWAGRGLLGLVKRHATRQSHPEQQAAPREQEASTPAQAAKEGVGPATEEVAIVRR